jgi:hypothetical protein
MRTFILAIICLLLATVAVGAPLDVGDTIPTSGVVELDAADAPTELITTDTWVVFDYASLGVSSVHAVTNSQCTIYLYRISMVGEDATVTQRWGPFYLRDWVPPMSLVPRGARAHAVQVESVVGQTLLVVRGG